MKHVVATAVLAAFVTGLTGGSAMAGDGQTVPKPVFQLGDTPSQPLESGSPEVMGFLEFFNATYQTGGKPQLPPLTKDQVVWFPPQRAGDTSLELVARVQELLPGKTASNPTNCNPGDPDFPPQGYPLVCDEGDFSSGQFCQACHDSALYVEGGGLPEMAYADEHEEWLANWSQYGDWSATIMRLATRDPIWQAQIETETNVHQYADPSVVQDVCFSCHGEMGERQLKVDIHELLSQPELKTAYMNALGVTEAEIEGSNPHFCTDVFYATVPGILSNKERGKPYPFNGDYCAPIAGLTVEENQQLYAKYGALARDGVSCETCHRIGPDGVDPAEGHSGSWNGTSFEVFYGPKDQFHVQERQTDNPVPLEYEFTATFEYDMHNIMAPDPVETLDTLPMQQDDNLTLATAVNQAVQDDAGNDVSYLQQSVLCGSCHVLIVPQIPASYQPGAALPDTPYYDKPAACTSSTFSTGDTRVINGKTVGNPLTDPCVGLGYEQATYLEWITSDFASEQNSDTTCQACHMPLVTNPDDPTDHTAIMAQSTEGLTGKTYRRHRLMGINLPVSEMFMQFPDVLGVFPYSDNVPDYAPLTEDGPDVAMLQNYLINGQSAIVEQATSQANGNGLEPNSLTPNPQASVEITDLVVGVDSNALVANMTLVNNTGHKFPSGAGFRRAFVKFEVLDSDGNVIWVSGQVNPYGAICNGPCVKNADGTYNLVSSETPEGQAANLQPHYEVVTAQHQVQVYEVQAVNDLGNLTSSTLALFHDAKDNRLLPRGFMGPEELGCEANPAAGTEIFGIPQCSAAYATEPQLDPLTVGSTIAVDPHYQTSAMAGSDALAYSIPLTSIGGTPASVRVSLEYQTIPPGFLAQRFTDGHTDAGFLPATERAVYLTSHLNLNLDLKSEHPDNTDVTFSQNWTSTIYQATAAVQSSLPMPVTKTVEIAPTMPEKSDGRTGCDPLPTPFYTGGLVPFDYSGEGPVIVSSTPDGTGETKVDDALRLVIFDADGTSVFQEQLDYASFCGSGVEMREPFDISEVFQGKPGRYLVGAQFVDIYPDKESGTSIYLVAP